MDYPFLTPADHYGWTSQTSFDNTYNEENASFPASSFEAHASATPSLAMATTHTQPAQVPATTQPRITEGQRQRSRHRDLDWDMHKADLKRLYLDENKTLEEIRQKMARDKSFNATPKQYKDKFRSWGWQKNLPAETAQFMVAKAKERKRAPPYKDTVFEFGGMCWTRERAEATVKRAKKALPEVMDLPTPNGVIYQTPASIDPTSPEAAHIPHDGPSDAMEVVSISSASEDEWESDAEADQHPLPLTWEGKTRADIYNLFLNAQHHVRQGDADTAEGMLTAAGRAYAHLLGRTHEETSKVVYTLATFYVEHDRIADAYSVIEKSCREYVDELGIEHRQTQQHLSHIVELLHGWNRDDDALAFLARAKSLAEGNAYSSTTRGRKRRKTPRVSSARATKPTNSQNTTLVDCMDSISNNADLVQLDYAISVTRNHATAKDEAVEQVLLKIINCGYDIQKTPIQHLQAWAELLKLYQTQGKVHFNYHRFVSARQAFDNIMSQYPWSLPTRERFKSLKVIEAALEVAAAFVKADYMDHDRLMFQKCEEKATEVFGSHDERTIWMLISIGLVYQNHKGWDRAKPWFEQALAAAMDEYGDDDGILISLEEAMEVRHFSYLSDEGRPYRTIFGVSGLRIMPTRLHL